jgi:hypothetical protein
MAELLLVKKKEILIENVSKAFQMVSSWYMVARDLLCFQNKIPLKQCTGTERCFSLQNPSL